MSPCNCYEWPQLVFESKALLIRRNWWLKGDTGHPDTGTVFMGLTTRGPFVAPMANIPLHLACLFLVYHVCCASTLQEWLQPLTSPGSSKVMSSLPFPTHIPHLQRCAPTQVVFSLSPLTFQCKADQNEQVWQLWYHTLLCFSAATLTTLVCPAWSR